VRRNTKKSKKKKPAQFAASGDGPPHLSHVKPDSMRWEWGFALSMALFTFIPGMLLIRSTVFIMGIFVCCLSVDSNLAVPSFKLGSAKLGQTWHSRLKLGILGSNLAIREMEHRIAES
jgi:hypothetical protein